MIKEVTLTYDKETNSFVVDGGGLADFEILGFIEAAKLAMTNTMTRGGNHASTSTSEGASNSDGVNAVS